MTTPRVTVPVEPEFTHYRRSQIAHLRPYVSGETLSDRVSISAADLEAGSPKPGDMIARNPANHDDQWLVAADYFAANFEPVSAAPAPEGGAVDVDVDDMRTRARYLRGYAPKVSAAMYGGENPSGVWNLNRAADLLDLAANALAALQAEQKGGA